jgi:putative FmdB family regulatory protein
MLFEYKCNHCSQITERLEHYTAPTIKDCDTCGSKASVHRMLSQSSFALDNSGWGKQSYTTNKFKG